MTQTSEQKPAEPPFGFAFNPKAVTPTEFASNVEFQLQNVRGFLMMGEDRPHDKAECVNAARIKAQCLVDASAALLAKLESDCRAEMARADARPTESEVAA